MIDATKVYHFSDTVRLPWIIGSGELRPSPNRLGGFPQDALWATTSANGDKTSAAFGREAQELWQMGALQLIRFTLDSDDFSNWKASLGQDPHWTSVHVARLECSARELGEPDTGKWRARRGKLPLTRVLAIHAKSYSSDRWETVEATPKNCIVYGEDRRRSFVIDDRAYGATRDGETYREFFTVPVRPAASVTIERKTPLGRSKVPFRSRESA